jgi:type II secretory pathway pseudopilin PulG
MFCGHCGSLNPDEARFCGKCGTALQTSGASTAAPIAPGAPIPAGVAAGTPYIQQEETSGKAVASLVCGFLFFFFPAALAAIILGHISLSDIRKSAGRLKGHGIAVGGLVLGYLGIVMIPLILIVAAIAIPNLLRSRMAANEASAVGSLRTIYQASVNYSETYKNGYPANLDVLTGIGIPSCDHAGLIGAQLAGGTRNGYVFTYEPSSGPVPQSVASKLEGNGCSIPGAAGFSVTADPITRGTTGQRSFFIDQTGVIRYDRTESATADSPPLE